MMNGVGSSFMTKVWTAIPTAPRTRMLRADERPDDDRRMGREHGARRKVRTARRCGAGTKGVRKHRQEPAFRDSMMRTPRNRRTLQPNPMHMGMKLLPWSPTRCMKPGP